jgi:hypothetical protein
MCETYSSLPIVVWVHVSNAARLQNSSQLIPRPADRKLDFTCCDIEAEIIARNAVFLTLIIDDPEDVRGIDLWKLYYHVFIDAVTQSILQIHAKKLLAHSGSLKLWDQSPYADTVRFCDETTLENVVELWKLYAIEPAQAGQYKKTQDILQSQ